MPELRGGPAERVGPLFDVTRRFPRLGKAVVVSLVAAAGLTGCATSAETVGDPGGAPTPVRTDPPPDLLARVRSAHDGGDFTNAAREADSLYFLWRDERGRSAYADSALWLEARSLADAGSPRPAAERLAEMLARELDDGMHADVIRFRAAVLVDLAREPEAVRLLVANPDAVEGEATWAVLRIATAGMSLDELAAVPGVTDPLNPVKASVAAEYARVLAAAGLPDEARRVARAVTVTDAETLDRDRAEAVLAGSIEPDPEPIRVGAVLPLTGRFAAVGRFLSNGMRIALERATTARDIELVIRDDESDPDRTVELILELEADGVAAILGPIRSQTFAAAIDARIYAGLLLVSPTATEMTSTGPNAYTLWDRARRTADVAFEVGRWLAAELRMNYLGALVTDSPTGRDALLAFRAGATREGAVLSGYAPYSPDSTTFAEPVEIVASYAPEAVFISTRDASAALQLGPQLSFYGLRRVVLVGGPSWAEPAVVRRLDPSFANYNLVGTFVDQFATDGAWTKFKRAYEIRHRTSLRDNMLPALGHDAMMLVIEALPERGPARPGAVGRAFAQLGSRQGASGELRIEPAASTVSRATLIRMILDRTLVDPDPVAVRTRLAESDAIESARARRRQTDAANAVSRAGRRSNGR